MQQFHEWYYGTDLTPGGHKAASMTAWYKCLEAVRFDLDKIAKELETMASRVREEDLPQAIREIANQIKSI